MAPKDIFNLFVTQTKSNFTKENSIKRVKRLFPAYRWIKKYNRTDLIYDVIAGLTVGMTIVPQSLAYATIAGLPIQYGLYSSFMGAFIYAIFGTSKDVTYGPTAVVSLLVFQYTQGANIQKFINPRGISNSTITPTSDPVLDDALKVHYAILMTFVCGLLQILMGSLHLGFLISFISHPILYGFTNAAAIIIGIGQIKNILGIKIPKSGFLKETVATFANIGKMNPWDCALGIISLVLLLVMKKLNRSNWLANLLFPLPKSQIPDVIIPQTPNKNQQQNVEENLETSKFILSDTKVMNSRQKMLHFLKKAFQKFVWLILTGRNAVIISLSALIAYFLMQSALFARKNYHISLTPSIQDQIPKFVMPKFAFNSSLVTNSSLQEPIYIPAIDVFKDIGTGFITISLIGILESLAIAKAFARKHKYAIDSTQEFIALGIANFLSSFVSSYPITASFSRTAINSQTGVRTPGGGIFTGILVLLALQYLTHYFKYIPKASLAAMIISAILNLIEFKIFYKIWKIRKSDFFVAIITLIACFFLGVEIGICTGIVLSLAFLIFPMSRPHLYISYEKLERDANRSFYVIKPNQSLFYPSSEYFSERIIRECLLQPMLDLESARAENGIVVEESSQNEIANNSVENNDKLKEDEPSSDQSFFPVKILNGKNLMNKFKKNGTLKAKKAAKALLADVIIDCSHIYDMDYTIIQELDELDKEFKAMNKYMILCNINEILEKNAGNKLGGLKIARDLEEAKYLLTSNLDKLEKF